MYNIKGMSKLTCICGNIHQFNLTQDGCMTPDIIAICNKCGRCYVVHFDNYDSVNILEIDKERAEDLLKHDKSLTKECF